ncbi:putative Ig domain-containing protein [Hydrogenimonas sp.]
MKKRRAFTLIELAIVLIIVGLLVGGGFKTMQIVSKRAKVTETKQTLAAAKEAVVGFAQTHGYLPNSSEFSSLVKQNSDSWGKPLLYTADSALMNDDICYYRSTQLVIGGDENVSDVAFVIVSGGENYNMQTARDTNEVKIYKPGKPNIDDNQSAQGDSVSRQEPYDDLAEWVTLQQLRIATGCKNAQMGIIPLSLPKAYENHEYNASVSFEGGVPYADGSDSDTEDDVEWCWEGSLPAGITVSCDGTLDASSGCLQGDGTKNGAANWNQCTSATLEGRVGASLQTVFKSRFYAHDGNDNIAKKEYSIVVEPDFPEIANTELPRATEGGSYDATIAATGGDGNYSFSLTSGTLPDSLSFSDDTISGTLDADTAGNYPLTFEVVDGTGRSAKRTLVLTVDSNETSGGGGGGGGSGGGGGGWPWP